MEGPDIDRDGLTNDDEAALGTDPRSPDSDGDGATDLVEVVAMSDPLDATSSPLARGDFYFTMPFARPPEPERASFAFGTSIRRADVYFAVDTSVSMQPIIDSVRADLGRVIAPRVLEEVPDARLGVGQFDHCPSAARPDARTCAGIRNELTPTDDLAAIDRALSALTADCWPVHEPYAQTVYAIATGDLSHWGGPMVPSCPDGGGRGLGCLRPDALPIIVVIGDEPFSESYDARGAICGGGCETCATFPTASDVEDALVRTGARLIVVGNTGRGDSGTTWRALAIASGSVGSDGSPLVFPDATADSAPGDIVDGVSRLAGGTPLDVHVRVTDIDHGDGVDAAQLVLRVEAEPSGGALDPRDPRVCISTDSVRDRDGDGAMDTFVDTAPGSIVCFTIIPRTNETVPAGAAPQVFRAALEVVADDITVVDRREVLFLVPPVEGTDLI